MTQTLDSASTQQGDVVLPGWSLPTCWSMELVAIPAGSAVAGHVDEVKDAAHFKGSASLTLSLASITRRGEHIPVTTDPYTVQGKGRGSNTAEKVGGGAAVGAILGGIFGGGKGRGDWRGGWRRYRRGRERRDPRAAGAGRLRDRGPLQAAERR